MKVAILAGGYGTRLLEETRSKPKPMVEVGGYPLLWHIMMHYTHHGFRHFLLALGYRADVIKRYMLDFSVLTGDLVVRTRSGEVRRRGGYKPDWTVEMIDTGLPTQTGGRIKRLAPHVGRETFMLTWGDGVSDVDLHGLLAFHRRHGKLATLTAVRPPARFGSLELDGDQVTEFSEKNQAKEGWINGAFFVLEPQVFDYISGDDTAFEKEPLERLAREGQLMAYRYTGFWQCMDTLRDQKLLESLWGTGRAPWKTWRDAESGPRIVPIGGGEHDPADSSVA